jgi:nucleoside-diphosphate-sugar epimerase
MSERIVVTGGSGHIGGRIIIDALEAGYSVHAVIRSHEKADLIRAMPSVKALDPKQKLTFAIVPDMLVNGAYDEAIKGATFAIHVASPLPIAHKEGESYQKTLIEPAVTGTLNILEAAKKAGTVKRVVITSSVLAICFFGDFSRLSPDFVIDEKSRTKFVPEPYAHSLEAYSASKIAALNETEAWMEREKGNVPFDVVNIFPSYVFGRDELVTKAGDALRGANSLVLGPVTGTTIDDPLPGSSVHVRDVALAHVKALNPKVPGNQGYLLTSGGLEGSRLEDATSIVARSYADAVKAGIIPNNGKITSSLVKFDASASEEALGMKFIGFEEQVKDVVGHYLELAAAAN